MKALDSRYRKTGRQDYYRPVPATDQVYELVLAAETAASLTVPEGARYVDFVPASGMSDYRVAADRTATIPGAAVTDGSACWLNPAFADLDGITQLSVISSSGGNLQLVFWGA